MSVQFPTRAQSLGVPRSWPGRVALVTVLLVALGVRCWGLRWSLPCATHYYSYHPDESTIVDAARRLDVFSGDLNPHFFNYGSLPLYLVHFACQFASGWGYLDFSPAGKGSLETLTKAHLVARLVTVLFGLATVWVVWLLGRRLGGEGPGLAAAGLLALCGGHAVNSHYATVDVPLTFWTTLSLLGAVGIVQERSAGRYALAGLAMGFACATKYGAVVLVVPLAVAHLLAGSGVERRDPRLLVLAVVLAVGAFFLGCPYAFLAWPEFRRDFLFELSHMRTGSGWLFTNTGNGWWYHLRQSLPLCLSWPVLLAALASLPVVLRNRQGPAGVLLAFAVAQFALLGKSEVRFVRYVLPLLPVLVILLGDVVWRLSADRPKWVRTCLLALLLGLSALHCVRCCRPFAQPDPRDRVVDWLQHNAKPGTAVGLLNAPWFYSPPLSPWNGGPKCSVVFKRDVTARLYPLRITSWDLAALETDPPPLFAMSEFEFREELRLCGEPLSATRLTESYDGLGETLEFWNGFHRQYEQVVRVGGWHSPWWLAPSGYVPHDWLYPCAEVRVYRHAP